MGNGKDHAAEYAAILREILAAFDRACDLSTHEFFFYNRAISRKNFGMAGGGETKKDFLRACATIANGMRSSVALFSYGEYLQDSNQELAKKFFAMAALDKDNNRANPRP